MAKPREITVTIRADMSKLVEALDRVTVAARETTHSVKKLRTAFWILRFREALHRCNQARLADVWP